MNAQRIPIVEPAITRPEYDNEFLGYELDWVLANLAALCVWWETLANAGCVPPTVPSKEEFRSFFASQHDIELARRDEYKRTLRQFS